MSTPSLRLSPVPHRPYWTASVSREETLAVREKFRKADWRQLNHKPSTTKVVVWVKRLWNRCVIPSDTVVGAHFGRAGQEARNGPSEGELMKTVMSGTSLVGSRETSLKRAFSHF
jgi:hypothetical protein